VSKAYEYDMLVICA